MVGKMVKDKAFGLMASLWFSFDLAIKEDLMKVFHELFVVGKFEKKKNSMPPLLHFFSRRLGHWRLRIIGPLDLCLGFIRLY